MVLQKQGALNHSSATHGEECSDLWSVLPHVPPCKRRMQGACCLFDLPAIGAMLCIAASRIPRTESLQSKRPYLEHATYRFLPRVVDGLRDLGSWMHRRATVAEARSQLAPRAVSVPAIDRILTHGTGACRLSVPNNRTQGSYRRAQIGLPCLGTRPHERHSPRRSRRVVRASSGVTFRVIGLIHARRARRYQLRGVADRLVRRRNAHRSWVPHYDQQRVIIRIPF